MLWQTDEVLIKENRSNSIKGILQTEKHRLICPQYKLKTANYAESLSVTLEKKPQEKFLSQFAKLAIVTGVLYILVKTLKTKRQKEIKQPINQPAHQR